MQNRLMLAVSFVSLHAASSLQYAAFDSASASSTYSKGNFDGTPTFSAQQSIASSAGYWCSAGSHTADGSVTWTGLLESRRKAVGIKVNWAYSPGEVKVLTSADGANFEEAIGWRQNARSEVAYEQTLLFPTPRNVKAVIVVMRNPLAWQYFGISDAVLLSEAGPMMLVSGVTSRNGEQCVVNLGDGALGVEPCLDAIAAGDGREIFTLTDDGSVTNLASQTCVMLVDGDTIAGGKLALRNCDRQFSDGRSMFEAQPNGQLKMPRIGNVCVTFVGDGLKPVVQDCVEAGRDADARDKFFLSAVPEHDSGVAIAAQSSAALLTAAEGTLGALVARLTDALPSLDSCALSLAGRSAAASSTAGAKPCGRASASMIGKSNTATRLHAQEPAGVAIHMIEKQLNVDMKVLPTLVEEARCALARVEEKLANS